MQRNNKSARLIHSLTGVSQYWKFCMCMCVQVLYTRRCWGGNLSPHKVLEPIWLFAPPPRALPLIRRLPTPFTQWSIVIMGSQKCQWVEFKSKWLKDEDCKSRQTKGFALPSLYIPPFLPSYLKVHDHCLPSDHPSSHKTKDQRGTPQ